MYVHHLAAYIQICQNRNQLNTKVSRGIHFFSGFNPVFHWRIYKKNLVYSLQRVEDFNSLHYIEIINHLNQIFWIVCHKSFSWWSSIITSHSEFSEIYSWKWVYLYCYITRLWSRFKHVVTGWFREQTLALNLRIYYVLHSSLSNPGFETLVLVRRAWQI